ncbi:hypothetical protein [Alteromonas sp. 14N.309.X.WAT.G.H12]|uniref:hypothetical protein n=1 Tax=Alteromonas sp. 14N.309.X.WAT.G.H12 TaxID=3120824 RepID=UPI002FD145C5
MSEFKSDKIDVYGDLTFDWVKLDEVGLNDEQLKELRNDEKSHTGFYIRIVSDAIESYVLQNSGDQVPTNNEHLEKLMAFSAKFCERTYAMGIRNTSPDGPDWVRKWLNTQGPIFVEHANAYQELYQRISHLTEKPYFISSWSMAFIVDIALEVEGVKDPLDYKSLPNKRIEDLNLIIDYAEHWITVFYQHLGFKS